jgi:two-component system response regulator MprA
MTVLLVEDNAGLAKNIARYLEAEGYPVRIALDGLAALELAEESAPSCVVLDLNLPKIDGLEVCRRLRASGFDGPLIMLTARSSRRDVVLGLDSGADDYLVKPFALQELVARMRALGRRSAPFRHPVIQLPGCELDTASRQVTREGRLVNLAPREYALLEHLAVNRGIAQERTALIEAVWGRYDDLMFSKTVDVHVSYLRRKLGSDVIVTVPGIGYMIPDGAPHVP